VSLIATTWSPGLSRSHSAFVAARPEPKPRQKRPPSSAARLSWSAVRVGFNVREYSYPCRGFAGASCSKVLVK
jgi:hypothetical protein